MFRVTVEQHFLGETLFTADYIRDGESGVATFLSAFDYQERTPLYFLCQLPEPTATISEALYASRTRITRGAGLIAHCEGLR